MPSDPKQLVQSWAKNQETGVGGGGGLSCVTRGQSLENEEAQTDGAAPTEADTNEASISVPALCPQSSHPILSRRL